MSEQHFNGLSPEECEALAILSEEMGEAQQIIGKILRHGLNSYNPNDPEKKCNSVLLSEEIGHVKYAIVIMLDLEVIDRAIVDAATRRKEKSIVPYLHHVKPEPLF